MSIEIPTPRDEARSQLEALNERRWDLLDELAQVELGRTACFMVLHEVDHE